MSFACSLDVKGFRVKVGAELPLGGDRGAVSGGWLSGLVFLGRVSTGNRGGGFDEGVKVTGSFGVVVEVNDVGADGGVRIEEESCGVVFGSVSERVEAPLGGKTKVGGKGSCSWDELDPGAPEELGVSEATQDFH